MEHPDPDSTCHFQEGTKDSLTFLDCKMVANSSSNHYPYYIVHVCIITYSSNPICNDTHLTIDIMWGVFEHIVDIYDEI